MFIGISTSPPSVKTHFNTDCATRLIFPIIEHLIPKTLDDLLAQHRPLPRRCDLLGPSQMLRFELLQACRPAMSFRQTLREVWQTWRLAGCVDGPIPASASFAEARTRLPAWALEMLFKHTAAWAAQTPVPTSWPNYRLLSIDGTPLTVPNTTANRSHFGATAHQHGEAYFPQALGLWVSHLCTGIVVAEHFDTSKVGDESIAPYLLEKLLQPSDLFLGDAHYGTFSTLSVGMRRGASFLCRAQGALDVDAHVINRHAPDDADVSLQLTPYMSRKYQNLALPEQLALRTVSFEIPLRDHLNGTEHANFFTNLPRSKFSPTSLAALARLRWNHETMNNDIKTRLGLGDIRSLVPEGVRHEVLAHLCVNNMLRLFLHRAQPQTPRLGSFTAALSALRQANEQCRMAPDRREVIIALLCDMILQQPIDVRPDRTEPRMIRPNKRPHRVFKTSRAQWREERKVG